MTVWDWARVVRGAWESSGNKVGSQRFQAVGDGLREVQVLVAGVPDQVLEHFVGIVAGGVSRRV
jgi:hypothetical protein